MNMAPSDASTSPGPSSGKSQSDSKTSTLIVVLAWLAVSLPLLWGVAQTFKKALTLFG
jgi:hypothetical protein